MNLYFENEIGEIVPFKNVIGIAYEKNEDFFTSKSEKYLLVYSSGGGETLRISLDEEKDKNQIENFKKWLNNHS